jgi:leucyl aminopeptidase (aminopeptidase T)
MSERPVPPETTLAGDSACRRGAATLVDGCARLRAGERAYVIANPSTAGVAEYVVSACRQRTNDVRLDVIEELSIHGAAPAAGPVGEGMLAAEVIFCLTRMSLAHTAERLAACRQGARFLSLPDYSLALLGSASLQFDFASAAPTALRLKHRLDGARRIEVRTEAGTDLRFSAEGRSANACPGICWQPGTLGSPPDAEVNIAPVEGTAEGVVQVDGSIPCREIGKLSEPITLQVRGGAIVGASGAAAKALEAVFERAGRPEARWLAEFGIGLNPLAAISGCMLEDEGCAGTFHLGFGSNATIGGRIRVPFHLDFVVRHPSAWVDGVQILDRGRVEEVAARAA